MKHMKRYTPWTASVCLIGAICLLVATIAPVRASDINWLFSPIDIGQQDDSISSLSLNGRDCRIQDGVSVHGLGFMTLCVTEGTKLRFAYSGSSIFVSKGRDQNFYFLQLSDSYPVLSRDSDRVIAFKSAGGSNASTFSVYEDASTRFVYSNGYYAFQTGSPSFQYDQSAYFVTIPRLSSDGSFAAYVGLSANQSSFVVKTVSLETGLTTSVGYVLDTAMYQKESYRDIAVSNDGRLVAINTMAATDNRDEPFRTIQVWENKDCDVESSEACETRLAKENVPPIGVPSGLEFDESATTVTLMDYRISTPGSYIYTRVTFSIGDLFDTKVDYLAMGDSYASGEGDTKNGHYLTGTDVLGDSTQPREMCHVSDRSYPFLLQNWLMQDKSVKSVACSGAFVSQDYSGSEYGYKGQQYRLADVPDVARSQMKKEALDISFIPGRNKQISFVKNYKPKAVTISGCGNDVGFGNIVSRCANPADTCEYAYNKKRINKLSQDIQHQYDVLIKLYRKMHENSPKTKIYVVGYPHFVSDDKDPCAPNVGLDQTERKFVREGVIMLNNVIEAAANAAGVKYIDIEDSLGSHVLCGESSPKYVTGITISKRWGQISNKEFFSSESFHPNSQGHYAMAKRIKSALGGESPVDYSYCQGSATVCPKNIQLHEVPLTPFFRTTSDIPHKQIGEIFAEHALQTLTGATVRISTDMLGKGTATVRIESTPRTLGTVEVGNDGVLDAEFPLPADIEPGFHTLYIDTVSPAGELITLWQPITIYGPNGDIDSNGVADNLQPCPFIAKSLQDSDQDGVDDRCDPEITVLETESDHLQSWDTQGIYEPSEPSNFASGTAKTLLASSSQHAIQRFLGYNAGDKIALKDIPKPPQELPKESDLSRPYTSDHKASFSFASLIIYIFPAVCIITIIGITYAKTKSKN